MNAFTVVSEFKFDVAEAIMSSERLQDSVNQLSGVVEQAMASMKTMSLGFLTQSFGGMNTGILGMVYAAISASDKFTDSQISFTQIIDSNMAHLSGTIDTMNGKMAVSKKIMEDIGGDAIKFGIPASELLSMTKTLSAMLVPKGLAGENMKGARDMSRNLLKSAPNLGIHPTDVQGQLLRSIEGSASMGDTLFRRLLTEAPEAFKANKVKDAKGFNALDAAKRFSILNEAMGKFSSNTELLTMRANTLAGVTQRLKDVFTGITSIFKPLGDAIIPPLIKMMNFAIDYLNTKGRDLIKIVGKTLSRLLEDPMKLLQEMDALRSAGGNFKLATQIVSLIMLFHHLSIAMNFLKKFPMGGKLFAWMAELPIMATLMKGMRGLFSGLGQAFQFLIPLIKPLLWGLAEMAGLIGVLFLAFHGISRAFSAMKVDTIEWFANNVVSLTETFDKLKNALSVIFAPLMWISDGFFELTYALLGGTYVLDILKEGFENFTMKMVGLSQVLGELYASFRGLVAGMFDVVFRTMENLGIVIKNIMSGNLAGAMDGTKNIFGGYMEAGAEEFMKTMDKFTTPNMDGNVDNAKVVNSVNNYDVKMTNNFKEVLQPDRIAFTIKDQLTKASQNRTQGQASSLAKGLAT